MGGHPLLIRTTTGRELHVARVSRGGGASSPDNS
jgi:hypothetical protein